MVDESKEQFNKTENSDEWEYEYEYVEVPEGGELPNVEGYEYVEVPPSEVDIKKSQFESVFDIDLDLGQSVNLDFIGDIDVEEISTEDFVSNSDIEVEEVSSDDFTISHNDIDVEEISAESFISSSDIEVEEVSDIIIPDNFDDPIEIFYEEDVSNLEDSVEVIPLEEVEEVKPVETIETKQYSPEVDIKIVEDYEVDFDTNLNASITTTSIADIENAKIFTKTNGVEIFQGHNSKNAIFIGDVDFEAGELDSWKLVIFDRNIVKLSSGDKQKTVPILNKAVRFAKLIKNGEEKLGFFNDAEFNFIPSDNEFGIANGKFIFGTIDSNSNILINDYINIQISHYEGKKITFNNPISGMLIGPKASILYFSDLKKLMVQGRGFEEDKNYLLDSNLSWYSGNLEDAFIKVNSSTPAANIVGRSGMNAIHIDVGTSTYGWNVSFDNGITMSIKDLQFYQLRSGAIPSSNGFISYGAKKFEFSNIKRIVLYEVPQYFAYGK